MSLIKLLKAPIKLFKKDVITFVIIRRYDLLGVMDDKLRYIAVRPSASISMLRQKVWHLLDLPDFCEEIIVLKLGGVVMPLTELRKGNDPQHPYILEVWLPANRFQSSTTVHNRLLTIENGDERLQHGNETLNDANTDTIYDAKHRDCIEVLRPYDCSASTISNETMALNKLRVNEDKLQEGSLLTDLKSELTCGVSRSSLFRVHGRKSRDNFTNIFLKIQSDLCTLNNKLSSLEYKMQT